MEGSCSLSIDIMLLLLLHILLNAIIVVVVEILLVNLETLDVISDDMDALRYIFLILFVVGVTHNNNNNNYTNTNNICIYMSSNLCVREFSLGKCEKRKTPNEIYMVFGCRNWHEMKMALGLFDNHAISLSHKDEKGRENV